MAYAEWLASVTGERYRLPSKAEWEYGAKAGSSTKCHFGNDESQLCQYANHADLDTDYDWRNTACSDGVGTGSAMVGTYQSKAFRLNDMHGNVWEGERDCWNHNCRGAPTEGSASADSH